MYIVCNHDIINQTTIILNIFADHTKAIEDLHRQSQNCAENCDVLIVDNGRIEIIERLPGWVFTTKKVINVYEIKEFPGQYLPCFLDSETSDR